MLVIPEEIQTILKNGQAIGENRPTGTLTVSGQPLSGYDPLDPTTWTDWIAFSTGTPNPKVNGNMTETADGRAILAYIEDGALKIAYASTPVAVLTQAETFDLANAVTLKTGMTDASVKIDLINGKLMMVLTYNNGTAYVAECWIDTDGNGTGFSKLSDMHTNLGDGSNSASLITKLGDGTLVCLLPVYFLYGGWNPNRSQVCVYSADGGAHWTIGPVATGYGWAAGNPASASGSLLLLSDTSFAQTCLRGIGTTSLNVWSDSGASFARYDSSALPTRSGFGQIVTNTGTEYYMIGNYSAWVGVWQFTGETFDLASINDMDNWTFLKELVNGSYYANTILVTTATAMIGQHQEHNAAEISGAGTLIETLTYRIPIKSIAIDRAKGEASKANVVLDNKNGMYAPDNILSDWYQVLWFNKQIELTLGYGDEQPTVYTGLIDDIKMDAYNSSGAQLTVYARDMSKLALDQSIAEWFTDHWAYVVIYQWQTLEYIFNDLALGCGFAAGAIHVEATGITQAEVKFSHQSYADGFQELCELSGFEWFCDEIGDIWFRKAVEPAPVAVYEYIEGVDIFSLGYLLSDAEIARNIVAYSKGVNGTFLRSDVEWSAANYNAVLPKKTIFVDATDIASTAEDVAALAQENADALDCKPRSVDFVAPCNPYIQIGDCLLVMEITTAISELYRVTDYGHVMVSEAGNGSAFSATTLKCYHYANVPS